MGSPNRFGYNLTSCEDIRGRDSVRPNDLLMLPLAALWQQKLRTMLTTMGVVFGAFVLAASLSIGEGVQQTIDRESHRNEISRMVQVFPNWNHSRYFITVGFAVNCLLN